jgi:hypothetical protein
MKRIHNLWLLSVRFATDLFQFSSYVFKLSIVFS